MNDLGYAQLPRHEWTPLPDVGVELHAQVWGDHAPKRAGVGPVVLVAGLGVSSRYLRPLGRRLGERVKVFAPDLPGFGHSRAPADAAWPAGPSAHEQADQLLAWMDARHIDRAALYGHSTGCQVAVDFASRFPHRVTKLILAGPPETPQRSLPTQASRLLRGALFETPSLHLLLNLEYGSAGPARVAQQGVRIAAEPFEDKLSRVDAPTLVIRGQWDPVAPRGWAQRVAERLPRGRLVEIERVGHAVHYSSPAIVTQLIDSFINDRWEDARLERETIVVPQDDPRRDRFGPPQPIPPSTHAAMDIAIGAAALILPRLLGWGKRSRRVMDAAAMASLVVNLLTDHGRGDSRKLPMIAHANADVGSGVGLLFASATVLHGEPRSARRAVAALGAYQILAALLTAKPTGPARYKGVM